MYLVRMDENGITQQYGLPYLEVQNNVQNELSGKEERIKKMLEKSGKLEKNLDLPNNLEDGYIYASISGYEYIKMDLHEFWWFINILNALANLDADELGFFGINLFVVKITDSGNKELVAFELGTNSNTVLGMCDALMSGDIKKENISKFFEMIRILG